MESVKYTRTCVRQNFVIYIQNKQNKHIYSEITLLLSELKGTVTSRNIFDTE